MASPRILSAAPEFTISRSSLRLFASALILEDSLAGSGQAPLTPAALLRQIRTPRGQWSPVAESSIAALPQCGSALELDWQVGVYSVEGQPSRVPPDAGLSRVTYELVAITTVTAFGFRSGDFLTRGDGFSAGCSTGGGSHSGVALRGVSGLAEDSPRHHLRPLRCAMYKPMTATVVRRATVPAPASRP